MYHCDVVLRKESHQADARSFLLAMTIEMGSRSAPRVVTGDNTNGNEDASFLPEQRLREETTNLKRLIFDQQSQENR